MNQEIRNKLRNVVTQCRRLLEDSVSQELEGKYGIFARGNQVTADPNALMIHLTEEEQEARKDILDHFGHIQARGFEPKDALDQLVREIAFTHLNRLCAYKMMEAREVYVGGQKFREAVSRGVHSNGVKFYLADHPEEERLFNTGHQDVAYRHFLDWLGGLLSEEIGVLFNPNDPANRLYPRQKTLDNVLDLLNGGGIPLEEAELRRQWPNIWSQDETIGWVYQYFTPKELRDQARKDSPAPRNSYELAFRNQFFTPRYVVEFLTDNTLGRLWYEMRKGKTSLTQGCRYLIRRSRQFFLQPGKLPPKPFVPGEWIEAMETREMWTCPPRIQKGLDDIWHYALTVDGHDFAREHLGRDCEELANEKLRDQLTTKSWSGSFEELRCCLFFEQRRWRHTGYDPEGAELTAVLTLFEAVCERWDSEVDFILDRPKKDPRDLKILDPACGSGHFLLYCFDLLLTIYEEAYDDSDLGPALQRDYKTLDDLRRDIPRLILAHNVHGIDIDPRASQIASLALWLRSQRAHQDFGSKKDRSSITRSNFICAESMPGEVQLLKEFVGQLEPKVLAQVVEVIFDKMKLAGEAGSLLRIEEEIRDAVAAAKMQWVSETSQATDRRGNPLLFTQSAMDRLAGKPHSPTLFDLSDITDHQFFEQAEANVIETLRQYAEKAQHIDRFQRRLFSQDAVRGFAFVDICQKRYDVVLMNPPFGAPTAKIGALLDDDAANNLYPAFVLRAFEQSTGFVGAITDRTFFVQESFKHYRSRLTTSNWSLRFALDLGWGVLDTADVQVAAYVVANQGDVRHQFLDVREDLDKATTITNSFADASQARVKVLTENHFRNIPNRAFAYSLPQVIIDMFGRGQSLGEIATLPRGLGSNKALRTYRVWFEVPEGSLGVKRRWRTLCNGGDFSPFFREDAGVADWLRPDGKSLVAEGYPDGFAAYDQKNTEHYFEAGLSFPKQSSIFNVAVLSGDAIPTREGKAIIPHNKEETWFLLGYLNSSLVRRIVEATSGLHKQSGSISLLPVPEFARELRSAIGSAAERFAKVQLRSLYFDETSRFFQGPKCLLKEAEAVLAGASPYSEIDACIFDGLNVDVSLRDSLRYAAPEIHQLFTPSSSSDLVSFALGSTFGRWSYEVGAVQPYTLLDAIPDVPLAMLRKAEERAGVDRGILVDDSESSDDVARCTVDSIERLTSSEQVDEIVASACQEMGVANLGEYFRSLGKDGFWQQHLDRYNKSRRRAPIYWLLQSSKRNYSIWLYYHRLDKDLLFKALVNHVEPKLRLETSRLDNILSQKNAAVGSSQESKRLAKQLERQEDFLSELGDFEEKLRRVANLHLVPDLNDGVLLNIAPLHELVPWKDAKNYWVELLKGKYEWSSIGKQLHQKGLVK